jgi:hypothetical protein
MVPDKKRKLKITMLSRILLVNIIFYLHRQGRDGIKCIVHISYNSCMFDHLLDI